MNMVAAVPDCMRQLPEKDLSGRCSPSNPCLIRYSGIEGSFSRVSIEVSRFLPSHLWVPVVEKEEKKQG